MAGKATVTFFDMRGRPTSMTVNTEQPSDVNYATLDSQTGALAAALLGISESGEYQTTLSDIVATGGPVDRGGLRGTKALIRWYAADEGDGGQYGSNEIGAVDPALFTVVGDKAILQGSAYTTLKTAFDAIAVTENGNAVSVYEVELVNRNI